MPEWMHSRAKHIMAKNPSMSESEAFAIATQQMHALGKSPKGYGTADGRHEAKSKYDTPKDDTKTADPGHLGEEKTAELSGSGVRYLAPLLGGFSEELEKIAFLKRVGKWARGKLGKAVVEGVTDHPENKAKAEKFVRDAAWSGVKDGLKRNAGKIGAGAAAVGAGATAMHVYGKHRRAQERDQLIRDLETRFRTPARASSTWLNKKANLSGTSGSPTTMGQISGTSGTTGKLGKQYTNVNSASPPSPVEQHQPTREPQQVRR